MEQRENREYQDESLPCPVRSRQYQDMARSPKLSRKRWLILLLFCVYSATNAFQWNQYVIIDDTIKEYYDVGSQAVDWTSMSYMAVYVPLIFPVSYVIENKGLKMVAVLTAALNVIGAGIKLCSAARGMFYLTLLGQMVYAVGNVFILGLPPRISALWFGHDEKNTATSIGVFGNQVGIAIGFLIPPMVMKSYSDDTHQGLLVLFYSSAIACAIQFVMVCIVFEDRPTFPPSKSQATLRDAENTKATIGGEEIRSAVSAYVTSIKSMMTDKGFILLFLAYGLNVGVFYSVSTILNRVILYYFGSSDDISGLAGLILVLAGLAGSILAGLILDKTKAYRVVSVTIYVLSLVGMLMFSFMLKYQSNALVFALSGILGFFLTGYLPVGFEYAKEITYPEPEGTSSGLINNAAQATGILLILVCGKLIDVYESPLSSNLVMCGCLLVGVLLTCLNNAKLKLQQEETGQRTS